MNRLFIYERDLVRKVQLSVKLKITVFHTSLPEKNRKNILNSYTLYLLK